MLLQFQLKDFAKAVRVKLAEDELNLLAAAEELGVSKATISRLQRAKGLPDIQTYQAICSWLDKPMEFFFEQQNTEQSKT